MKELSKVFKTIGKTRGCKFAAITYRSKGANELACHTILLGASLKKAYESDLETLLNYKPQGDIEEKATFEMISSIQKSLTKGIGKNESYTQKGVWSQVIPNVRIDSSGERIQVLGMVTNKRVIEAGTYKTIKSSPKTLAKKAIKKALNLKVPRIRAFSLESANINRIAGNGDVLEIA